MKRFLSPLVASYGSLLNSSPLATKVSTSLGVFTLADLAVQGYEIVVSSGGGGWAYQKRLGGDDNKRDKGTVPIKHQVASSSSSSSSSGDSTIPIESSLDDPVPLSRLPQSYSPSRTLRMSAFSVSSATFIHFWWNALERVSSRMGWGVVAKVAADQIFGAVV